MTAPADLREQAYRLEIALEREPGDARAALIRAVAVRLRALANELCLDCWGERTAEPEHHSRKGESEQEAQDR